MNRFILGLTVHSTLSMFLQFSSHIIVWRLDIFLISLLYGSAVLSRLLVVRSGDFGYPSHDFSVQPEQDKHGPPCSPFDEWIYISFSEKKVHCRFTIFQNIYLMVPKVHSHTFFFFRNWDTNVQGYAVKPMWANELFPKFLRLIYWIQTLKKVNYIVLCYTLIIATYLVNDVLVLH